MDIGTTLGLLIAIALLWFVLKRKRKPDMMPSPRQERSEIDAWIEEMLARELGKKSPLGKDLLLAALRGDPEPAAVSAIEEAVRKVQVSYAKLPVEKSFEVRAEIFFEDGSSRTESLRIDEGKVPGPIREEFELRGSSYVFREWRFPWYGTDQGFSAS